MEVDFQLIYLNIACSIFQDRSKMEAGHHQTMTKILLSMHYCLEHIKSRDGEIISHSCVQKYHNFRSGIY
jgi:hypothetical protein